MRCCASYRISFQLYQSGLLGRVHNRCPMATACLSKWGARGCGAARIVPPDQRPVWMMEQDRLMTFKLLSGQSENIAAFEEVVPSGRPRAPPPPRPRRSRLSRRALGIRRAAPIARSSRRLRTSLRGLACDRVPFILS